MIRSSPYNRLYEAVLAFALLTSQAECFSTSHLSPLQSIDRRTHHTSSIVSNSYYYHDVVVGNQHSVPTALYSTASEEANTTPTSSEMTEMDAAQKRETPTLTPEDKLFILTIKPPKYAHLSQQKLVHQFIDLACNKRESHALAELKHYDITYVNSKTKVEGKDIYVRLL